MPDEISFNQAARKLRSHMGRSQQSMATELGVSMAALRNYESGAVTKPDARALAAYLIRSKYIDRPRMDLANVFYDLLQTELGYALWSLARAHTTRRALTWKANN